MLGRTSQLRHKGPLCLPAPQNVGPGMLGRPVLLTPLRIRSSSPARTLIVRMRRHASIDRGVDLSRQGLPDSDGYLRLDRSSDRIRIARDTIATWPDAAERNEADILVTVFGRRGLAAQKVFVRRAVPGVPNSVSERFLGTSAGGTLTPPPRGVQPARPLKANDRPDIPSGVESRAPWAHARLAARCRGHVYVLSACR
jgi:hypothetical protein